MKVWAHIRAVDESGWGNTYASLEILLWPIEDEARKTAGTDAVICFNTDEVPMHSSMSVGAYYKKGLDLWIKEHSHWHIAIRKYLKLPVPEETAQLEKYMHEQFSRAQRRGRNEE